METPEPINSVLRMGDDFAAFTRSAVIDFIRTDEMRVSVLDANAETIEHWKKWASEWVEAESVDIVQEERTLKITVK